jgi:hypothetical protein
MRRTLLLVLLGLGASCGKDDPVDGPTPGVLIARLTTSHTQDGALLLRVLGPVTDVTPIGYTSASRSVGGAIMIVVTGNIIGGDLLRLSVPDTRELDSYSVEVQQAADRNTFALREPGSYSISLRVQ